MTKKQVEIVNKTGLHARPASDFVLEAKKYESKITICRENGVPVNANPLYGFWRKESDREPK